MSNKVVHLQPLEETLEINRFCMKLISDRYRNGHLVPKQWQKAYSEMMAFEAKHGAKNEC